MSSDQVKQIVAVVACLIAFVGFIVLSSNPRTPQIEAKVSEEQTITILKTRALQDGGGVNPIIVWGGTITNAELNYTSLDWSTYFDGARSYVKRFQEPQRPGSIPLVPQAIKRFLTHTFKFSLR